MQPTSALYRGAVACLVALLVASALILLYGQSPLRIYQVILSSTWGDSYGIGQVLFKATPLCLTGLAVAFAFRGGLFNIGAEGQLTMGAFTAGVVGASLPLGLPSWLGVISVVAAALGAGALLGAIPGVLRAYRGSHEVIVTIMLNFIASALVLFLGNWFFFAEETTHTASIPEMFALPSLQLGGSAANASIAIAIAAALIVAYIFKKTVLGFELRALGQSPRVAESAGVSARKLQVTAMAVSGALAGLAGVGFVLGNKLYFEDGMGRGAGFMGIAVALMGQNRPLGILVAALIFGTLGHGGLSVNYLVPKEIIDVLQAVIILVVALTSALGQRGVKR